MKLNLLLAAACVGVLAFGTGCSSGTVAPPVKAAVVSDSVAITQLMSAQLPPLSRSTPKVGKARLANDDDDSSVTSDSASPSDVSDVSDGESAPKSVRRSDGSRRHGGFGTTK